jgi:hypothetical protein
MVSAPGGQDSMNRTLLEPMFSRTRLPDASSFFGHITGKKLDPIPQDSRVAGEGKLGSAPDSVASRTGTKTIGTIRRGGSETYSRPLVRSRSLMSWKILAMSKSNCAAYSSRIFRISSTISSFMISPWSGYRSVCTRVVFARILVGWVETQLADNCWVTTQPTRSSLISTNQGFFRL